ncbi:MAG: CapA family protein [Patescibacteria group bacterium]|nr:CapA family protein [Patescibacteria group bacterium]
MSKIYWLIFSILVLIVGLIFALIYFKNTQYFFEDVEYFYSATQENIENQALKNDSLINIKKTENLINQNEIKELKRRILLMAVGDIMLSRDVATKIRQHQNYKYPFLKTAELLKSADITFGNLETAITPGKIVQTESMSFRSDPEIVEGLKYAGFDILSLANNHTPNFGEAGLKDTFKYLQDANISYIGAGNNILEARQPAIKEIKGIKFAFLAYNDTDVVPDNYQATQDRAGTVFMDIDKMKIDVQQAKQKSDVVIVSMHSGTEYTPEPSSRQIEFAHTAIDAGASLVLGHHPHVIQTFEKYKNGFIFYSLGNFVFDQMWSQETREGLIAEIVFEDKDIVGIEFYPTIIEDFSQPRFADAEEEKRILKKLKIDFQSQPVFIWDGENYQKNWRQNLSFKNQENIFKTSQEADINNDGQNEKVIIKDGILYIYQAEKIIWQSESDWQVENVILDDIDNDQKIDIIVSLWKFGKYGPDLPFWLDENINDWASHLFIYKWDGAKIKLFWGSSSLDAPIREMAVEDVNNDQQNELIVLEGDYQNLANPVADYLSIWHWHEWSFYNDFRSDLNQFYNLQIKNFGDKKVIYVQN